MSHERRWALGVAALLASAPLGGCQSAGPERGSAPAPSGSAAVASSAAPAALPAVPIDRQGSSVARAVEDDLLFVADEDHSALRLVPLPLGSAAAPGTFFLPGRPAQVLALPGRVLVTVRDLPEGGGALLVMKRGPGLDLAEVGRVVLPADAWGLALSPDSSVVLVSSAFSGVISVVDLATLKVRASVPVAREPRGMTFSEGSDRAYVSHLIGSAVTRLDGLSGSSPTATRLELPASPLRAPKGDKLPASLGYTVVPSPRGERLFFPRLALGALGPSAWAGAAAVDVWLTGPGEPLVPTPSAALPRPPLEENAPGTVELSGGAGAFAQPRAALYRADARTLLVACEGQEVLVELDALMTDPTFGVVRTYALGDCGAPTGLVFSADRETVFVHCRTSDGVKAISLIAGEGDYQARPPPSVTLEKTDPGDDLQRGRALFYDAGDESVSGGLACSGCHPEGRDDGHVWHEARFIDALREQEATNFLGGPRSLEGLHQDPEAVADSDGYGCGGMSNFVTLELDEENRALGYARQTPMLAGRVGAPGPYGWHAESPTLEARIRAGFGLHRWRMAPGEPKELQDKARQLALFVRQGLVPPPRAERPLTPQEERGKALFLSPETRCAGCHVPTSGFTDRAAVPLGEAPARAGFVAEEDRAYKTPSLLHVGSTPPYFHDGRFDTLEVLLEKNADSMGKTSHLSAEERAALVAYLRTL